MEVHLIITFTSKAEKREEFATLLADVRKELPRVPGCRSVHVFESAGDPCVFTLLETWESQELHRAHIEKVRNSGAWDHIASHLAREPTSGYFRDL